jgi:anaerobic selenocysteine-containing dehydrogenase
MGAVPCLGIVEVIIDGKLYDNDFVRDWCVGFDGSKTRLAE